MSEHFFVSPDVATLFHANRYMDANPTATYDDLMSWMRTTLNSRFPWYVVTPDIEARIRTRLHTGKAIDA